MPHVAWSCHASLIYSSLWPFIRLSLFMTLRASRTTGQLSCRVSSYLDVSVILLTFRAGQCVFVKNTRVVVKCPFHHSISAVHDTHATGSVKAAFVGFSSVKLLLSLHLLYSLKWVIKSSSPQSGDAEWAYAGREVKLCFRGVGHPCLLFGVLLWERFVSSSLIY